MTLKGFLKSGHPPTLAPKDALIDTAPRGWKHVAGELLNTRNKGLGQSWSGD